MVGKPTLRDLLLFFSQSTLDLNRNNRKTVVMTKVQVTFL